MKNLTPFIIILVLFLVSCSSPYESVVALQEVHRQPAEGETCITQQNRAALRYAKEITSDDEEGSVELEDPVSYCREQISGIGDASLSSPRLRGAAVYILSFTALRSPSSLVRTEAFKALEETCKNDTKKFVALDPNISVEEWKQLCERWRDLWGDMPPVGVRSSRPGVEDIKTRRDDHLKKGRLDSTWRSEPPLKAHVIAEEEEKKVASPEQIEQAGKLLEEFSTIIVDAAPVAWDSLALLTVVRPPGEGWEDETGLYARVIDSLIGQAFFLTTCEAAFDASPTASRQAAEALFHFDFDDMGSLLRLRMERCYDPPLRILILKNLGTLHLSPGDLGGKLMTSVRESLDFRDPGVVFHAVELFKNLTRIRENDPGYWRQWWSDHVVEFADG